MLWFCKFTWQSHATRKEIAKHILRQHDDGTTHPEHIRAWYNLAGGGAGFMLVETETPQELTAFLQPYMDVVSFDVHAVYPVDYEKLIKELRQVA
jgi:hypothetical protein